MTARWRHFDINMNSLFLWWQFYGGTGIGTWHAAQTCFDTNVSFLIQTGFCSTKLKIFSMITLKCCIWVCKFLLDEVSVLFIGRWSGRAMMLGNFKCLCILIIWIIVGQGLTVLAVFAGGVEVLGYFFLSPTMPLFFLSPSGRRLDKDWTVVCETHKPTTINRPAHCF